MTIKWLSLIAVSAVLALAFDILRLPAAIMLGPMVAGIAFGIRDANLHVPRALAVLAQSVIGCLVAMSAGPDIVRPFLNDWPIALAVVLSAILAANAIGLAMMRRGTLPGTTAIWGCSPGGAFTMIMMAEAWGGDARLVAFMQYTRVVVVAIVASIVARLWLGVDATPHAVDWFPPVRWLPLLQTGALIVVGATVGTISRIPAGPFLVPVVAGGVLGALGWIEFELPPWLLAASFALVAWSIGLGFTRAILLHALRALPQIVLSMVLLVGFCGVVAVLYSRYAGVDLLTAYLAASPGGLDSVTIIAASSNVDVATVMAVQTVRLFAMILIGPLAARTAIRLAGVRPPTS